MDFDQHLREQAEHLLSMASHPGWRDHALYRLRELQAADPMYAALDGLIRELKKEAADAPRSQD